MAPEHTLNFRVRYAECDPMGVAHHSVYAVWFEMGRTELLRSTGLTYRQLEERGVFLAVIELNIKYKRAARYDDELTLTTRLTNVGHVKIEHSYELHRGPELIATATSVLACLDKSGRPQPIPEEIHWQEEKEPPMDTDEHG